jgi:hypothetical protein
VNSEQILDRLDESRERLLVALQDLPDEALQQPGVMGDWSIADVLAHLTVWESEMVTGLMYIAQGRRPTPLLDAFRNVDAYNARRYAESRDRPLDRVFDDWQSARRHLEGWVERLSEKELSDPQRYAWAEGAPLQQLIAANSYQHELEHLPEIETFAGRWLQSHASAPES